MNYENAAKGIKLVLIGELVELFSQIIGIAFSTGTVSTAASIISSIFSLIALCATIYGLFIAMRDEDTFKNALEITVGLTIVRLVLSVMDLIGISVSETMNVTMAVFDTLATLLILRGIYNIYVRKDKSTKLLFITSIVFTASQFIGMAIQLWSTIAIAKMSEEESMAITGVLSLVYVVVALIGYVMFLFCLGRGVDGVKSNNSNNSIQPLS